MTLGSMQTNGIYQICISAHGIIRSTIHGMNLMALNLQMKKARITLKISLELLKISLILRYSQANDGIAFQWIAHLYLEALGRQKTGPKGKCLRGEGFFCLDLFTAFMRPLR